MRYFYHSKVGTFIITFTVNRKWGLFIHDELLGEYESPVAAADDVYVHVTSYWPWDKLDGTNIPEPHDLSEWTCEP